MVTIYELAEKYAFTDVIFHNGYTFTTPKNDPQTLKVPNRGLGILIQDTVGRKIVEMAMAHEWGHHQGLTGEEIIERREAMKEKNELDEREEKLFDIETDFRCESQANLGSLCHMICVENRDPIETIGSMFGIYLFDRDFLGFWENSYVPTREQLTEIIDYYMPWLSVSSRKEGLEYGLRLMEDLRSSVINSEEWIRYKNSRGGFQ